MGNKNILFLSTLNFTSNPRLFKEVQLAMREGYVITVVLFKLGNWSDKLEENKIAELKGAKLVYLNASSRETFPWLLGSIMENFYSLFVSQNSYNNSIGHSKRSWLLLTKCKEIELSSISLIVAHNLGALYPAYYFAKKCGIPFGFDVEDFHPGELVKRKNSVRERKRRESLMQRLLTHSKYITYASSLISEATNNLISAGYAQERAVVLNSFRTVEFVEPKKNKAEKIQFVWFSQNITTGRGLELILPVIKIFRNKIDLTLIGNISEDFKSFINQYKDCIILKAAMNQEVLHKMLSNFDVGLAVDINDTDENREYALSNKIIAYKQAGLFILATDTLAQKEFISRFPGEGLVVKQTEEAVKKGVCRIYENIEIIRGRKTERFKTGKTLSWEIESNKLLTIWNNILKV